MSKQQQKKGFLNHRHSLLSISLMVVTLIVLAIPVTQVQTTSSSETKIHFWGHVTDATTGHPLHDATIDIWELRPSLGHSQIFYIQTAQVTTEYNGSYQVAFDGKLTAYYRVYAYYDDPRTPGYDYLLTFHESTQTEANIDFHLVPSASILLETTAVMFVDAPDPPLFYDFIVLPNEEFPYDAVLEYGENYHSPLIGINANNIIVPANISLQIEVKAWGPYTRTGLEVHSVILGVPDFFVHKGELIHVNVMQYSTPININVTKTALNCTESHLTEAEEKGFYATTERQYLKVVHALIQSAEDKLAYGSYHDSYADIREAYLKVLKIDRIVQNMYTDAATSVHIIIVFLAFTATASGHIIFVHHNKQRLASGIAYLTFLLLFYHFYYGSQIVELPLLAGIAVGSLLASESIALIMPRVFSQTIAVTFAMAKRSLLRRKIRFILTLIPIIVLVMGFVALTSFTTEHGFVSKTVATAAPGSNGLLVKGPLPRFLSLVDYNASDGVASTVATFTALTPSDVEWLNRTPEVTVVAPLVENIASRYPLGSLSTATDHVSLYGVLGLSSNEPAISAFDRLVVDGRFLQDAEDDAVLISVQAAAALNVAVGDRLSLSVGGSFIEVSLVGLLDDSELGQLTDSDGAPIVPEKIVVVKDAAGFVLEKRIALCEFSEVVVLDWRTTLELSSLFAVSRMGVVLGDAVNPLPFARQLALTRDFWVWSVADEHVTFFGSIAYFEAKGLSIFVPWVIAILTIVVTMINVIYERRNEVAVLSSVGLNPTHITAIFGAEALMIGVIGGGVGYLLGQSSYKLTSFLSLDILVEQKVSAVWSFASLGIAITAVIVGAFLALKTSTIITPSLLRRWSVERGGHFTGEPWVLDIPFKVNEEDLHAMTEHVIARFRRHLQSLGIDEATTAITVRDDDQDGASRRTITFETLLGDRSKVGALPFQLVATRGDENDAYVLHVVCKGPEDIIKETVRFLRTTIIEWSATKERNLRQAKN